MKWGEIIKDNAWYIDECFLLPNRVLSNPDRFHGDEVRAFWTHWYKLAESGQHFTFKRVGNYQPNEGDLDEEKGVEYDKEGGSASDEQLGADMTPSSCKLDKEKISFLRSLLPQQEHKYHSIITTLASMEVCTYVSYGASSNMEHQDGEDTDIRFPVGCFSWKWKSLHSDSTLHTPDRTRLEALFDWLNQNPHMVSGKLVSRAILFRICLGLGLLLKDANLIQFTEEGGYSDETPGYIVQSTWGTDEVDYFSAYILKVKTNLSRPSTRTR